MIKTVSALAESSRHLLCEVCADIHMERVNKEDDLEKLRVAIAGLYEIETECEIADDYTKGVKNNG